MEIDKMITIKSPAKINLFLNIVNKRKDGFHDIETYFQLINLYDEIHLDYYSGSSIKFFSNNDNLSITDNLCIRAAKLLKDYANLNTNTGATIKLNKNIPIGAGLGGGSSNAASVLLGLNNLWKCKLSEKELFRLGKSLGSDVPVFIGGSSAYGTDTGATLIKHEVEKKFFLIIYPKIEVSSKEMYSKYKIKDCIKHINLDNMHQNIGFNSFEDLLCCEYRQIKELLSLLREHNNGFVSGSGSCVFSIFDDEKKAKQVSEFIPKIYQTYIVHSINRI
jgi:4-diphosphocytidyl-2-C-methyl-D-erythritol kinase